MPKNDSKKNKGNKKEDSKKMTSKSQEKKKVDIEALIEDLEGQTQSKADFFDLLGSEKDRKGQEESTSDEYDSDDEIIVSKKMQEDLKRIEEQKEKKGPLKKEIETSPEEKEVDISPDNDENEKEEKPAEEIEDQKEKKIEGSFFDLIGDKKGYSPVKSVSEEAEKEKEEESIKEPESLYSDDEIIVSKKMQEDLKRIKEQKEKEGPIPKETKIPPVEKGADIPPKAIGPSDQSLIDSLKDSLADDQKTVRDLGKFIEILSQAADDDPLEEAVSHMSKKLDQVNTNTKQISVILNNLQSRLDSLLGIEEKPQFKGLGDETRRVAVEVDMLPPNTRISITELARLTNMEKEKVENSIKELIANSWKIEFTEEEVKLLGLLSKKKMFVYKNY